MAQYTTKRKYTKKPTTKLKKVVKKVKKETVEAVEAVVDVPAATVPVVKSYWQKAVDWVKGLVS
jgi:phosphoribosyl-ATP pyrophosphohydrolase